MTRRYRTKLWLDFDLDLLLFTHRVVTLHYEYERGAWIALTRAFNY